MGYIVDITIVLEILFWFKVAQPRLPLASLCEDYESIYRLVLITHQSRGPVAGAIASKPRIWYPGSRPTLCPVLPQADFPNLRMPTYLLIYTASSF
jgi:hypothetical protein